MLCSKLSDDASSKSANEPQAILVEIPEKRNWIRLTALEFRSFRFSEVDMRKVLEAHLTAAPNFSTVSTPTEFVSAI